MSNFVVIAEGMVFPEGPAIDSEGRLHWVDCDTGLIHRLGDTGSVEEFADTHGIPVSIAFNNFGEMFVPDSQHRSILQISKHGHVSNYCDQADGMPLNGPNDLCFGPNGVLYFTDPKGSSIEDPIGRVIACDSVGKATVLADGFPFPNGIAIDAKAKFIYFAVTWTRSFYRIELPDGPPQLFAQLQGDRGPDGMAFDQEGYLYAAHFGKGVVARIDPNGNVVEELDAGGSNPTNCCFGGPENQVLYVTEAEHGRVIAMKRSVPGLPLNLP